MIGGDGGSRKVFYQEYCAIPPQIFPFNKEEKEKKLFQFSRRFLLKSNKFSPLPHYREPFMQAWNFVAVVRVTP